MIPIEEVRVLPERQRSDMGDIEELAKSIANAGLINPIVVDENNVLIAGERRLRACKALGMDMIETRLLSNLTEIEKELIELEENAKRKNLTWQEHTDAVYRYCEMRRNEEPGISVVELALELGVSKSKLSEDLNIAQAVKDDNNIAGLDKRGSALKAMAKNKMRDQREALNALDLSSSPAPTQSKEVVRGPCELLNEDFLKWIHTYEGLPFDFIHCDFPYGIEIDKSGDQLSSEHQSQYSDSFDIFTRLILGLSEARDMGIIAPNSHLMFWCATKYLQETRVLLQDAGFTVKHTPLIWHKSDGKGVSPNPYYDARHVYETALIATVGDRHIRRVVDDVYAGPVSNKWHRNEKPFYILMHFFNMFVKRGETRMLDPTCGSASSVKAARINQSKYALGLEIDPAIYKDARLHLGSILERGE